MPKRFKEKIDSPELFGANLLDFEYILLDVNRYEKAELIEKQSIASAIFLLDQKIDVVEYLDRMATIAQAFNTLTNKEKLELKNWIRNTVQEEIAEQAMEILDANKEEVKNMVANITRTIEEIKEQAEHRGLAKGLEEGIEKGLEEGMERGIQKGIERGIQKGVQEGKLDVAKALLDILDDDTIAIKTGLPLAIVQDLRIKN